MTTNNQPTTNNPQPTTHNIQPTTTSLQDICERGQIELMETRYLDAATTFELAEKQAWHRGDFDTLSRLYLPLQEARRQIRQRCGEGAVQLHLLAKDPADALDVSAIIQQHPHGQLLVGGWQSVQPAIDIRNRAHDQNLYLETFLAAVIPGVDGQMKLAILPYAQASTISSDNLPPNTLLITPEQLPADTPRGNATSFAGVMDLWERLHTPFLQAAGQQTDEIARMQAYRDLLQIDSACELAHQYLADIARSLARRR